MIIIYFCIKKYPIKNITKLYSYFYFEKSRLTRVCFICDPVCTFSQYHVE